jgi:hypothetical protein
MSNKIEIVIDRDSEFPSILELASIMDELDPAEPIDINWKNTRDEVLALRGYSGKHFKLHVNDFPARDRTTNTLGLPLFIEPSVLERARMLLIDAKTNDWRNFCEETSKTTPAKSILLKLTADSLRKGKTPATADIMGPLLFGGIAIVDVDVLLRLKSRSR